MPELIEDYLACLGGHIRWQRARQPLEAELRTHLLEQQAACMEQGMGEGEAKAEALRQMGDPEEIGQQLDRIHRPRPQWALLGLVSGLALAGAGIRLQAADYAPALVLAWLALSFGGLIGGYFLDYRVLGRHGGAVCLAAIGAVSLTLLPPASKAAPYLELLLPTAYALGVYACRGRRYGGWLIAALTLGVLALSACCHSTLAMLLLAVSVVTTLCYAGKKGWLPRPGQAAFWGIGLAGAATALTVGLALRGGLGRLPLMLHPELDPQGQGYLALTVREALQACAPWGAGRELSHPLPEAATTFILTQWAGLGGLIPCILLCLALTALIVLALVKCRRQRNALGGLLALTAVLTLGVQLAASLTANAGLVLLTADCPFISGNAHTVIDMGLMGLTLSVFRQERLSETAKAQPAAEPSRAARMQVSEQAQA